jgi:hypothetical protein
MTNHDPTTIEPRFTAPRGSNSAEIYDVQMKTADRMNQS